MTNTFIKELGEYIPGVKSTITLNGIKEFVIIPYYIDWYMSKESNKVFPIFFQEISDLNPTNRKIPGGLTRNPFFDHAQIKFFIAYQNDKSAGRIIAFIDYSYNKTHGEKVGWLGFFESIEDSAMAESLFEAGINFDILNPLFKIGKIAMTWRVYGLKI